jgi:hypothetical protein
VLFLTLRYTLRASERAENCPHKVTATIPASWKRSEPLQRYLFGVGGRCLLRFRDITILVPPTLFSFSTSGKNPEFFQNGKENPH